MVTVRSHLAQDPYRPLAAWPEGTSVQWGEGGLVIHEDGSGTTVPAFFEAFPPKGFIRGEGASLEEAEQAAFATFTRETNCQHRWGRGGHLSGAAICAKCGAFQMDVFKRVVKLGGWCEPLRITEIESAAAGYLESCIARRHSGADELKFRKRSRRTWLRCRTQGIDLPPIPEIAAPDIYLLKTPFARACRAAVCEALDRAEIRVPEAEGRGLMGVFDALGQRKLRRMLEAWRTERAAAHEAPSP